MMDDLYNNVNVWHNGTKISICQHWDSPSERINGTAAMQYNESSGESDARTAQTATGSAT